MGLLAETHWRKLLGSKNMTLQRAAAFCSKRPTTKLRYLSGFMKNITSSKATSTVLFLAAILGGQDKTAEENVTARIDASLTANGGFQRTF